MGTSGWGWGSAIKNNSILPHHVQENTDRSGCHTGAKKFLQPVSRPTRHNNSKAYQRYQTKKDCFVNARTIAEWNKLPEEIVNIGEIETFNGWQLAKMKKSIPDMSLP